MDVGQTHKQKDMASLSQARLHLKSRTAEAQDPCMNFCTVGERPCKGACGVATTAFAAAQQHELDGHVAQAEPPLP